MEHQRRADLMLLLTTSFWGISNCLTAICLRDMQPLTLNAFRFVIAFLVLGFVIAVVCALSKKQPPKKLGCAGCPNAASCGAKCEEADA